MGRQPRQRPISCHLCRVRKLRCSRQFPCSNCTSRGVSCQHDDVAGPPPSAAVVAAAVDARPLTGSSQAGSPKDVAVSDLLARLERLESLLVSQVKQRPGPASEGSPVPAAAEPSSMGTMPVGLASRAVPPKLQRLMTDALRLEKSYLDQKLTDSILADPIIFRTCPVRVVCSQPAFAIQNRGSFSNHEVDAIKCIWLPTRHEMRAIAQKFLTDISLFHHVIHAPTFHSLIEDVYSKLESNAPVEVGRVLLLVSICASATYAWSARDDPGNIFSSIAEANSQSIFWVKQGLDVSDHAQRISHASMEAVQGLIILFFVLCNLESVSQRARNVIMIAIATATELQLHRIDGCLPVPTSPLARMGQVKKEIGRRIWWYLVTMDWLLAHFNPLQEGFCVLHVGHMIVNWPKNVRDEDLVEGREIIERPMSEPTCVSYLIQRIRLAELTQWMTERHSRTGNASQPYSSTDILETDAKLKAFIGGIPDFLSLDSSSLSHLPPTDPRRSPLVAAQRYALNLILHRQLCKMHLPYLARGTVDPAYAYSRDVCLRSASVVIGLDHKFLEEHLQFCISKLRLSMVLRSVFLASIALALNACVKSDAGDGVDGLDDAAGPWQMLLGAYDQAPSGNRLLELSIQLLRKYKIKHDALETLQRQMLEATASASGSHPMVPEPGHMEHTTMATTPSTHTCASEPGPAMMEQHGWQRFEGKPQMDMGLNVVDWDKLFWGSDAPFI